MMKKNLKKLAALLASAALAVSPMTGVLSVSAEEGGADNGMVRSYLTGKLVPESIGRSRPIAVMFNNITEALPQSGISNAEVVYEAPVEGSITRLLGILEDYQDVDRIGSVRSARNYYIYFAREFDAYFMHYGQAFYALDLINLSTTDNLSGMGDGVNVVSDAVYYRSDDFAAPHNVFTNYAMIQDGIDQRGYSREYSLFSGDRGHYLFAADGERVTLDGGEDVVAVKPGYSFNDPFFVYDPVSQKYTRYQYGDVQTDYLTGRGLTYDNILFQYCGWENFDENGYLNIDVLSGGAGKYFTNGKAIDITWRKDAVDLENTLAEENFGATRYYDAEGNEITLNQGKTWVCIIQDSYTDQIETWADMSSFMGSMN